MLSFIYQKERKNNIQFMLVVLALRKTRRGRAQWLIPVIPALWEAEAGGSLEVKVDHQPGQHGETLSPLKIQKLVRCGGVDL